VVIALNKADGSGVASNATSVIAWGGGAPAIGDLVVVGIAAATDGIAFAWPPGFVRIGLFEPADTVGSMEVRAKWPADGTEAPTNITHPVVLNGACGASYSGVTSFAPGASFNRETAGVNSHNPGLFVIGDALERLLVYLAAKTGIDVFVPPAGFASAQTVLGAALSVNQSFKVVAAAASYGGNYSDAGVVDWASIGVPMLGTGRGMIGGTPGGGFL
jgi:hypothetical protein